MGPSGQRSMESSCSLLNLLPAFSTPTVSPSSARSPQRRLQRGEAVEQRAGRCCRRVPALQSSVFPRFCSPKAEPSWSLSLWVTLRPVQGLGKPGLGREVVIGGCCLRGGQDREEPGQSTALPSLITFLHTLRSRTSQPPNNSFSSPSP